MDKILEVKRLKVAFRTTNGTLKAVRDISFDLERGKTLAIVGESGSGKSVTSKAIIGILAGNAIVEGGEILYDGKDLLRVPEDVMHKLRGDKISMIFQDPLSSLNPIVKIGKQITEAMLLKNKSNRREARKDFNDMLRLLKTHMLAASDAKDAARINEMCATFDKFSIQATKLEQAYNAAHSEATELISNLEDLLFKASKKQNIDYKARLNELAQKLPRIENPYFTYHYQAQLQSTRANLLSAAKTDGEARPAAAVKAMEELRALLQQIVAQNRPDFFRIGFYLYKNPNADLSEQPIDKLNEETLKFLDEHFMLEFVSMEEKGVAHSYNAALEAKKQVLAELKKAHDFYLGDFDKASAKQLCKQLTAKIAPSIDRLEVIKDSAAYAFGTSLDHAIDQYFYHMRNNPREEARFARQTRRRESLIARGKTVEWKVIPKNVYDLSDLKGNILTVIDRLIERYEAYVANSAHVDFHARGIALVDFFKEKASQAVYRITKSMAKERAIHLMEEVGIHETRTRYNQYPFEISGGMRQRIVIAIALAADPDILICDEPTTALDVTIQAQILELINKLKRERNLSIIFITHDLGVVANMADNIAVMYAGKIVEYGTANDIFYDPRHPYTWALLSSMPDLDTKEKLESIPGTPPNMIYPPQGDAFADRNKYAMKIDFEQQPPMFKVSETHSAATWLLHPDAPKVEMPKIISARIERMKKAEVE